MYWGAALSGTFLAGFFSLPLLTQTVYEAGEAASPQAAGSLEEKRFVATHVKTPDAVKGIYMTQCVAGTRDFRESLVKLVDETELNTIIIDVKDFSGGISFIPDDPELKDFLSSRCYARDMRDFIAYLHSKGIYVVARITVFQDPFFAKKHPDLAIQKASDRTLWADYKGIHYLDPGAKKAWEYIVALGKESYAAGFDELNFDYIRFPSDGNMKDIYYPWSEARVTADPAHGKALVLRDFFSYLHESFEGSGAVLSADLFGMTMTNTDDLNIGQVLEYAAPYFDYIAPMVYPSHYPKGFNGYQNVNAHPYDIVKFSMDRGAARLAAATSTPLKLRPWLQDNDYPVPYTPEMVRAQIQAVYDAGLTSWMLWDAGNTYTSAALDGE